MPVCVCVTVGVKEMLSQNRAFLTLLKANSKAIKFNSEAGIDPWPWVDQLMLLSYNVNYKIMGIVTVPNTLLKCK